MRSTADSRPGKSWRCLTVWLCAGLLEALLGGGAARADLPAFAEEGVGGTGVAPADEGVGGTGINPERGGDDDGVGGTGILGTITGFGSILTNGLEVEYDARTRIEIDGEPVSPAELVVGQIVRVEAETVGGELRAQRVSVRSEVKGPVWAFDPASHELNVLGQTVELRRGALLYDRVRGRSMSADELRSGHFVRVSGLRRADGTIVASRLERTLPAVEVRVAGPVTAVESGAFRIFDLPVRSLPAEATIHVGDRVVVTGRWQRGALRSARVEVEPEVPFSERFERVSVEGYVRAGGKGEGLRLHGLTVDFSELPGTAGGLAEIADEVRVRVSGRLLAERRIAVQRIDVEDVHSERGGWRSIGTRDSRARGESRKRAEWRDRVEGKESRGAERDEDSDRDDDTDSDSDGGSASDSDDSAGDSEDDSDDVPEDDSDDD